MQYTQNKSRNQTKCKVCYDAGYHHICNNHKTKGEIDHHVKENIIQQRWPINKEIGKVTLCPFLQNTVCTNPNCFNGQNGIIRFPSFGHSISHCPCLWPKGWNQQEPMEYMRYTGYTQQQWRQIEQNQQQINETNQKKTILRQEVEILRNAKKKSS